MPLPQLTSLAVEVGSLTATSLHSHWSGDNLHLRMREGHKSIRVISVSHKKNFSRHHANAWPQSENPISFNFVGVVLFQPQFIH